MNSLVGSEPSIRHGHITDFVLGRAYYYLPLEENEHFVRRTKILDALDKKLFHQRRREVALVGLGGTGKTQIALQFAYDVKRTRPEYSIFWISALSKGSFHQSCMAITSMLRVQDSQENPKVALHNYLKSNKGGKCLVIVDNADDVNTLYGSSEKRGGLYQYLSNTQHGITLFTTRSKDLARRSSQGEVIEIDQMEVKEAVQLLYKLSVPKRLLREEKQTMELLDELRYLPLAISQAGAYLVRNDISIDRYLGLIRSAEKTMVDLMSQALEDNTTHEKEQRAVATTWLVSFHQIQKIDANAAAVLAFLSCIEPKAIPESLLEGFRNLNKTKLIEAIGTLSCYSFIKRREDGKLLDMHSLVHLAARVWLRESAQAATTIKSALEQFLTIVPAAQWDHQMIWRDYMPHALRIIQDDMTKHLQTRYDLSIWVGHFLLQDGRIAEGLVRLEDAFQWMKQHLVEDDPSRLKSQYYLAAAYTRNGQAQDAIPLLQRLVQIGSRVRAEDRLLRWQTELAMAYSTADQTKSAIRLLEQVVEIQSKKLPEDDAYRLSSQRKLASAYLKNGQIQDAIRLLEHVITIMSRTLVEDHPSQLVAQHSLATAYLEQGNAKGAIRLLERIVESESKTAAEDNHNRLVSQHELARAYLEHGETRRAVELFERVVAIRRRTLVDDHHDRVRSEEALRVARKQLQSSHHSV